MGSPRTWELLNSCWMAVRWEYLYSSSVGLHIVALAPIRQYFSWFYFLRSEWNIESEILPEEGRNLWIFTIWLALSGCWPHTSSIWPWSGTPKVHLYNTFLGSLHHGCPHSLLLLRLQCKALWFCYLRILHRQLFKTCFCSCKAAVFQWPRGIPLENNGPYGSSLPHWEAVALKLLVILCNHACCLDDECHPG